MTPTLFAILGLSLFMSPALAQTQLSQAPSVPPATASTAKAAFGVLPGRWVRIQGGYVITINSVEADGRLDANYANPRPLPFHTAVATSDGNSLKLFFELRAAGYNGSTYTLNYDAANDRLMGVYDQAVVKQKSKSMLRLYGDPKPRLPSELFVNLYFCFLQWRPFPE